MERILGKYGNFKYHYILNIVNFVLRGNIAAELKEDRSRDYVIILKPWYIIILKASR